ncbi:MAG: AAA family ATPase [Candidatus Obscuribacterales bacterium]|nr:AAA family ATPase [Candidatus Obscuribacterales bacterium]
MPLTDFHIQGYRSVRDVWLKLQNINVIIGPNGCGKTNLYRGIHLIAAASTGSFSKALADEGGMPSSLWAGKRRTSEPVAMQLSVRLDDYRYSLVCGLAGKVRRTETFARDPFVLKEEVFLLKNGQKSSLLKRTKQSVTARTSDGKRADYTLQIQDNESVFSGLRDPHAFPELFALREEFRAWRFYHNFRTDVGSPVRSPHVPLFTPVLSHDGHDLASAVASIIEAGQADLFNEMVEIAFPGSSIFTAETRGLLNLYMSMPGFARPFSIAELSDGTLQYLCLLAALLSLRAPPLMVLNEPESSLHRDLLESLAKLVVHASKDTQIWLTTHSRELADYILDMSGYEPVELEKVEGETRLVGVGLGGYKEDDDETQSS